MASRPPDNWPRPGSKPGPKPGSKQGPKPGATREQVDRRERFERARRDSLRSTEADGPVIMYAGTR